MPTITWTVGEDALFTQRHDSRETIPVVISEILESGLIRVHNASENWSVVTNTGRLKRP